ncbi:hypothetical protein B7P43_G07074, partial [Cryptotermes secundus]
VRANQINVQIPRSTVPDALYKRLHLRAYKIQMIHELKPSDQVAHTNFTVDMLERIYASHLAPSDYHLFTYLKNWLGSQRFGNSELMEGEKTWLRSHAGVNFSDTRIQKLILRYKFLNSDGDYAEK